MSESKAFERVEMTAQEREHYQKQISECVAFFNATIISTRSIRLLKQEHYRDVIEMLPGAGLSVVNDSAWCVIVGRAA